MARKFSDANSELDDALRLERRAYREFFVNKIAFMQRFPKLHDKTKEWFAAQRAKLSESYSPAPTR
jgi:hypothetical protein